MEVNRKQVNKQRPGADALRKISIISCLLKLIPIPVGIVTADLISQIVEQAADGQTDAVVKTGLVLIIFVTLIRIFLIITEIAYQKAESNVLHGCKMDLYRIFLENPLAALYSTDSGTAKEKLNDDFNTVTQKYVSLYPSFWVGMITTVVYFVFIAKQNMTVAGILFGMSLLQLIPPVIISKFLQVNYENCREIEAQLTDFTVSGYRGFQVIKLYDLKQWWLGQLKEYHKKYAKIGNASIYAVTAEGTLKDFIATLIKYGTYGILGLLIMTKRAEMDVAVEAIALSTGFFAAMRGIFAAIPKLGVAKIAEKRLSGWYAPAVHDVKTSFQNKTQQTGRNMTFDDDAGSYDKCIIFRNVSCRLGEKVILKDAGFVLEADKTCIIKGKNGIGKSTLLRLIAGLLHCEQGSIEAGGMNPVEFGETIFPERMFYLPQVDTSFDFTPFELYEMVDEAQIAAIREMAERFNLTDKQILNTKISNLSGGERKKVYLALAFALNPDFLLLDEPTNSLDQKSRQTLAALLQERCGGALIITHDEILDKTAHRFYRMTEGGIAVE